MGGGHSGSTPSCKAQHLTPGLFGKNDKGTEGPSQEGAGQVHLFGEQDRNPFAEAQLYSTIEMWWFCRWNHLEPSMSKTFLSHIRYLCSPKCNDISGAGGPSESARNPPFPSEARLPPGTPTYLFDEVSPGVGGNGVDHLQGLGERGGAVGERRALLGCGPISRGGGRLAAREKEGQGLLFLSNDTPWPAREWRPHKGPWPTGPYPGRSRPSGRRPSGPGGPHRPFLSPHQGATG